MKSSIELSQNTFLLTIFLVISIVLFTNIISENLIFLVIRSILTLIFILFLPGFLLMKILFNKNETSLLIVLSVCLSICITIIDALIFSILNMTISFVSIMNLLSLTTLILGSLVYWKGIKNER